MTALKTMNASVTAESACMHPFLNAADYPISGYIEGRLCLSKAPDLCCLPCPATDYTYSYAFHASDKAAQAMHVVGAVVLTLWILTHARYSARARHGYMNICISVSALLLCVGFVVPLATQAEKCDNKITPNDMYSSDSCAWSGALVAFSALSIVTWTIIRALSMHLQVCWNIMPKAMFPLLAYTFGWGVPLGLLIAALMVSGVGFRFSSACSVKYDESMAVFWGPLLGLSAAAALLQIATAAYCIYVFCQHFWMEHVKTELDAGTSRNTTFALCQRLRRVIELQWRSMFLVIVIVADVSLFTVVFALTSGSFSRNWDIAEPWARCISSRPRSECLLLTRGWVVDETLVVTVNLLFSLVGVKVFLLLVQPEVVSELLKGLKKYLRTTGPDRRSGQGASLQSQRAPRLSLKFSTTTLNILGGGTIEEPRRSLQSEV